MQCKFIVPFFVFSIITFSGSQLCAQNNQAYSFVVAGHAYGAHAGTNIGLHPPFINALQTLDKVTLDFLVFTGDIVNHSSVESWKQVNTELNNFGLPYYFVMGNHDNDALGYAVFDSLYGESYYHFDAHRQRFIILNSGETIRSISKNQLQFLNSSLESLPDSIGQVCIFFHELLWNSHVKYEGLKSNSRSRYGNIKDDSNFWQDVMPMLNKYADKQFYVFAGDVGGNEDAIASFYDKWQNVSFFASGMGEVEDENFLLVKVDEFGAFNFTLMPLREGVVLHSIYNYVVPAKPIAIIGDTLIKLPNIPYNYLVEPVSNAEYYQWILPEHVTGHSIENKIELEFSAAFVEGEISVKAMNKAYGSSEATVLNLKREATSWVATEKLTFNCWISLDQLFLKAKGDNICHINVFDARANLHLSKSLEMNESIAKIDLSFMPAGLYIVQVRSNHEQFVKKVYLNR